MEQTYPEGGFSLRRPRFLQELFIVGLGYLAYSQVRGLAADRVLDAFANGNRIVEVERDLGIFKELALQSWVLPNQVLEHAFNVIYVYGLFPLLLPTAIFLFLRRPHVYLLARNAFLASGAIAICFYLLLPTAPPRLLGIGIIDTLNSGLTPGYNSLPGVNHYAALPSMHVGWNFLTALSLYLAFDRFRGRVLLLMLPVIMLTSTVVTGNHYFLDGALGLLVAAVGLAIALSMRRWQYQRSRASAHAPSRASSS